MRMYKVITVSLLALGLVACGKTEVASFTVANPEVCQSTGDCELFMDIRVGGEPFNEAEHYPESSEADIVKVQWGDGESYQATLPRCLFNGVCRFVGTGLMLHHQFDVRGGLRVDADIVGEVFPSVSGYLLMDIPVERDTTVFATYNTGLSDGHVDYYDERKPLILEELNQVDADVVCLQEMWKEADEELFTERLASKFPYFHYEVTSNLLNFSKGNNGLLILSRYPLKNLDYKQLDYFFLNRGALFATVETPAQGDVDVACTHLSTEIAIPPYWGDYESWEDEQNAQARDIVAWREIDVLMGDFNSGLSTPKITEYTPEAFEIIAEAGYFSPYMENDPTGTWCAENPVAQWDGGDLVLDHVFLDGKFRNADITTSRLLDQHISVETGGETKTIRLSDHYGIRLEIH